jgi:hypothetical protein
MVPTPTVPSASRPWASVALERRGTWPSRLARRCSLRLPRRHAAGGRDLSDRMHVSGAHMARTKHGTGSFLILESKIKCVILELIRAAMQCAPDRIRGGCLPISRPRSALSPGGPEHQPTTRRHHLLSPELVSRTLQARTAWTSQEASDLPMPVLPSYEARTKPKMFL